VHLASKGVSWIYILLYEPLSQEKSAIIKIELGEIVDLALTGFFTQNVIGGLSVIRTENGLILNIEGSTGLGGGRNECKSLVIWTPGDSSYA
jgi:hypothetical protein